MQQRVAIARVLTLSPKIFLMDEPFGALDALTWVEIMTVILVTHNIDEAMLLAERITILSPIQGENSTW